MKKIFQNLNLYLFFVLFIATAAMLFLLEYSLSFDRIDNLNNQKKIITKLTKLNTDDLELALIQFNAKSTRLHQKIDELRILYKYAYIDKYLVKNQDEYLQDLAKLSKLTDIFNQTAHQYYTDTKEQKLERTTKEDLEIALKNINSYIDSMLLKNIQYIEKKFYILKNFSLFIFFIILFATIYFYPTLKAIYRDIEFLQHVGKDKSNYTIFSHEADAIALRMNRRVLKEDPELIDTLTNTYNYKGLLHAYSSLKKKSKGSNFTSVTVLEIDNLSKAKEFFSQKNIETILRKVAYTITLHEQFGDIIARTDYNQFIVILSRSSKEQAYKDMELIRESIAELKFNISHQKGLQITISGGFFIKPSNTSIEEAIKHAKEILQYTQSTATNKILQSRDLGQKHI